MLYKQKQKSKLQKVRGVDDSQKSYIHTLKPQIQSIEPRKGRLGTKAIPCVLPCRAASLKRFLVLLILTPWIDIDFQFLKTYGTQKSNGWIKSYGSRKFAVLRSICHHSFCDISVVLTPIFSHEQSLERELDNLRNGISFNLF